MTARHPKRQKVTKADYARAAEFLKTMGTQAAAIDIGIDKVRIVTTDGQDLTLGKDDATLDRELAEFRRENGYGGP